MSMVHVLAVITAKPGRRDDILAAFRANVPAVHAEDPCWLDRSLLAKAKKEGNLVVYGSMNEKEALPLWKFLDDITGIKTTYIRASGYWSRISTILKPSSA